MSTRNVPNTIDAMYASLEEHARTIREAQGQGELSFSPSAHVARGVPFTGELFATIAASSFVSTQKAVITIENVRLDAGRTYMIIAKMKLATPASGPDSQTFYVTAQDAGLSTVDAASVLSEYTMLISAETDDFDAVWTDIYIANGELLSDVSLTIPSGWGIAARTSIFVANAVLSILDVGKT